MARKEVTPKTEGEVVATYEEALVAGYYGEKVDPLPDSAYTVEGSVARGKEAIAKAKADDEREPGYSLKSNDSY